MKLHVYAQDGTTNELTLAGVAAVKVRPELIQQAVVAELANERSPHGHSKSRGEVRGGGRKPWRQKGTGRARHSSVRSPVWVGGGIAFGPKSNQNFSRQLPKQMRKKAFQMALVAQLNQGIFRVMANWPATDGKTKALKLSLGFLPDMGRRVLFILHSFEEPVVRALMNLADVRLTTPASVRTSDLLVADTIVLDRAAFDQLMARAFGATDTSETKQEIKAAPMKSVVPAAAKLAKETA